MHKVEKELTDKFAQAKAEHEKGFQAAQEDFARQIATLKEQHEKAIAEKELAIAKDLRRAQAYYASR